VSEATIHRIRRRPRNPWLLRAPADDAAELLLCLPYLGTGASTFHAWPRRIGDAEVCPIQPPGREGRLREPSAESYAELAEGLVEGLSGVLDRPFAVFGHCGSAIVAAEVALAFERAGGVLPKRVFASSMFAPHESRTADIIGVPDERLGDVVAETMRARGGEPLPELVELSLEPMRADVRAYRAYRREAPVALPCPLTVIGWTQDRSVPVERLAAWDGYGDVDQVVLDGDHWAFMAAPEALRLLIAAA
jgi:surfactin synthase thioesterase subunit